MDISLYLIIASISCAAFFIKGITGTGTATVTVGLSSFFIDPKLSIVLASFINVFGGIAMLKIAPVPLAKKFWIPIVITIVFGSIIGASTLKIMPKSYFEIILGLIFSGISIFFFIQKSSSLPANAKPPDKASALDKFVGFIAGFCGGFVAVNAPPLVYHFGKYLDKTHLRRLLIIIYIPAAIAQTATFIANGMFTKEVLGYGLAMIPGMFLGIYLGNRCFNFISESLFRKILAVFLVIVSLRLIFRGFF